MEANNQRSENKVTLSKYGLENQKPRQRTGVVVNRFKAGLSDNSVTILWEDGKEEQMHESEIDIL